MKDVVDGKLISVVDVERMDELSSMGVGEHVVTTGGGGGVVCHASMFTIDSSPYRSVGTDVHP